MSLDGAILIVLPLTVHGVGCTHTHVGSWLEMVCHLKSRSLFFHLEVKMPIPVIPTLHNQSAQILTRIEDISAYVIRWFFANPGETSTPFEAELISFRKFNALKGNTPSELCSNIASTLNAILGRFDDDVQVECTHKMLTGKDEAGNIKGNYEIYIAVRRSNGDPIIPTSAIVIGDNNKSIDIRFSGLKDLS